MPSRKKGDGPLTEREKMALIRYCQGLIGDKAKLSKKTMLNISIRLHRHNFNFDMGIGETVIQLVGKFRF
jgi:hypothetical protein